MRMGRKLERACYDLTDFPYRGRPGLIPGTRELVSVRPYVITYTIEGDIVEIVGIQHAAQARIPDPPS